MKSAWIRDMAGMAITAGLAAVLAAATALVQFGTPWPAYANPEERLIAAVSSSSAPPSTAAAEAGEIDAAELLEYVEGRRGAVMVVDARPRLFWEIGHIPGALPLSRENFAADYREARHRLEPRREALIVVYCSDPACEDSHAVARALAGLGFPNVRRFTGGMEQWEARGFPVQEGTAP